MFIEVVKLRKTLFFVFTKTNTCVSHIFIDLDTIVCNVYPLLYLSVHYLWNMKHLTFFKMFIF